MENSELSAPSSGTSKVVGVIVGIALIVGLIVWRTGRSENPIDSAGATPSPSVVEAKKKYKDGTFAATGSYVSPGGPESVGVSVVLAGGVITDAQFVIKAERPTSKTFQAKFAASFQSLVVGKPIDEVALTVVNGSSLTPKGFMDALAKIKVQAAL